MIVYICHIRHASMHIKKTFFNVRTKYSVGQDIFFDFQLCTSIDTVTILFLLSIEVHSTI